MKWTDSETEVLARRKNRGEGGEPEMKRVNPTAMLADVDLPSPDTALLASLEEGSLSVSAMIHMVLSTYRKRTALGWRHRQAGGGLATQFTYLGYADLQRQVKAIASALIHHPDFALPSGAMVCQLGLTGPEYLAIDLALFSGGLVPVPLQTTAPLDDLCGIIREVGSPLILVACEHLHTAVSASLRCDSVRAILAFDYDPDLPEDRSALADAQARLAEAGRPISLKTFQEVVKAGALLPEIQVQPAPADDDPLAMILYTSGTTGTPKGAIYRTSTVQSIWSMKPSMAVVDLSYQPLNHMYGRARLYLSLVAGGLTCFGGRGDLSTLLDDIVSVRPTVLGLVPRVSELLYQRASAELDRQPGLTMEELRGRLLGGRLKQVTTSSAPTSPELTRFIEDLTGTKLIDSYGNTEAGLIAINGRIARPPIIDYKLIDVPELGYFTTDKPHPRGEIAVRSPRVIPGYFARPDLNAGLIDQDGFYHTGDIVEEIAPDEIRYLDRRNNVLKLAQGEFVAVAKLETIFAGSDPLIKQVYVYGNSTRAFLLAVVVPNLQACPPGASEEDLKSILLNALREIGRKQSLNSYEIPRDIIVETEPFSHENGLLAGVGKLLRPKMKERYQDRLEGMYARIARQQDEQLRDLRANGRMRSTEETVIAAAASVLGISPIAPGTPVSFADLGGDSLSAVSMTLLVEDIYGLSIDVADVLHPTSKLQDLAAKIDLLRSGVTKRRVDSDAVHGKDASMLRADDLTLEKFIGEALLRRADGLPAAPDTEPAMVLLTGATGFLGRFLCLEWLQRLHKTGGTLVCIGRGGDAASARQRLFEAFDTGDRGLSAAFAALAEDHLEVLAGDLTEQRLGLSEEDWDRLGRNVDHIVHNGAMVNHKLPYRQLFQPNVGSVAELVQLSLTYHQKRFTFVSSLAAAVGPVVLGEEDDVLTAIPEWQLSASRYADGYGASKWAAEVLLRRAHDRYQLPVNIFRPSMILAHRFFVGQLNVPDMFTRWILSILLTRIAPLSFYDSERAKAHYDGLPVDFTAQAIVAISETCRSGYHNFHAVNPHDDGVSLDTFVNWIEAEGIQIDWLENYDQWYSRFKTALIQLPDDVRTASVLAVLDAYAKPLPAGGGKANAPQFVEAVKSAFDARQEIPHLGPPLIRKYLSDLEHLSLTRPGQAQD
jgi:fatty acid CoA ligase FadD9